LPLLELDRSFAGNDIARLFHGACGKIAFQPVARAAGRQTVRGAILAAKGTGNEVIASRQRGIDSTNVGNGGRSVGALTCLTDAEVAEIADAEAFLKRADDGDESVLPAVRKLLALPGMVDQMGGNLAARAQKALVDGMCGKRLADKEALLHKLASLRAELAGPSPTPLEQLVVERIVACWLQLHSLELSYGSQASMAMELATYYQKSMDRAQKRYLTAIKALAYVRRMARPVLVANCSLTAA